MTINTQKISKFISNNFYTTVIIFCSILSLLFSVYFINNDLAILYNDARSHLNISRRVVDGLKPGLAQLGSVWLPLPHILMLTTIWMDFFWHTGLSGAIPSMISYIVTTILICKILSLFKVGKLGQFISVLIFSLNLNILYLQSTAMTEMLLLATTTAACYFLIKWFKNDILLDLIKSGLWMMVASLVRYDGWFLLGISTILIALNVWHKKNLETAEGVSILFATLSGFGIALWLLWNALIFKDPLYFAFGPFSAHSQQLQFESEGRLSTKGNFLLSNQIYIHTVLYGSYTIPVILAVVGFIALMLYDKSSLSLRISALTLLSPFGFNVISLYLGHSILFLPDYSSEHTWFNVRYGVLMLPAISFGVGYLVDAWKSMRTTLIGLVMFVILFAWLNRDAFVLDDGRLGKSTKDVAGISNILHDHAYNSEGYVLISTSSHDAIVFSSGLPMKRFINEGTGVYWESAVANPEKWAKWIVVRTGDDSDYLWKSLKNNLDLSKYIQIGEYPFADLYELKTP